MGVYDELMQSFYAMRQITDANRNLYLMPDASLLHDGKLLKNAVEYIELLHSLKDKEITIDADYDADGIFSGTVLYAGLHILGIGSRVNLYPPESSNGYGLTPRAAEALLYRFPNTQVVLTTDNGITAFGGIDALRKRQIYVLVSDHHLAKDHLPQANVLVDPNQLRDVYPFKGLSGTGVIWKLLLEYAKQYSPSQVQNILDLGVFVGLSNITDVMPLVDENRYLTKSALVVLNHPAWLEQRVNVSSVYYGLLAMQRVILANSKYDTMFDERSIGFQIGPMLNSSRRMLGTSGAGFNVFLADSLQNAIVAVESLYDINNQRKLESTRASNAVLQKLFSEDDDESQASIVELLHIREGFAGLVAGKICERYQLPTMILADSPRDNVLLTVQDEYDLEHSADQISGSGRAPSWANLINILDNVAIDTTGVLLSYGGHAGACGFSIVSGKLAEFKQSFNKFAAQQLAKQLAEGGLADDQVVNETIMLTTPEQKSDGVMIDVNDVTDLIDVYKALKKFGPFGHDFEEPLFGFDLKTSLYRVAYMGDQNQHLKILLDNGLELVKWNGALEYQRFAGAKVFITARLDVNSFRDMVKPQFIVEQIFYTKETIDHEI